MDEESSRLDGGQRGRKRLLLIFLALILLLIAGGAGTWLYSSHQSPSPVPKNVIKSVDFPVYYPDPKLLPAGYALDANSFSSGNGVVDYSVSDSSGKKLVFTVQQRPSDLEIKGFYSAHMPITIKIQTNLGTANVGVINKLNVYSLPTKDAWLIISTSLQLKDDQIKSLLNTLTTP